MRFFEKTSIAQCTVRVRTEVDVYESAAVRIGSRLIVVNQNPGCLLMERPAEEMARHLKGVPHPQTNLPMSPRLMHCLGSQTWNESIDVDCLSSPFSHMSNLHNKRTAKLLDLPRSRPYFP